MPPPPAAKVHLVEKNSKAGNTGTCVVLVPGGGHNVLGLGGCKAMVPFLHGLGVSKATDGGVIQAHHRSHMPYRRLETCYWHECARRNGSVTTPQQPKIHRVDP